MRMRRGDLSVGIVGPSPAEADDLAPPFPFPERGAGTVQQQDIAAAFAVAPDSLFRARSGLRLAAGAGDHVQDQQFAVLFPFAAFEQSPVVLEKPDAFMQIGGQFAVNVFAGFLSVMTVAEEIDHGSSFPFMFSDPAGASGRFQVNSNKA